jgi:hypothetical protein
MDLLLLQTFFRSPVLVMLLVLALPTQPVHADRLVVLNDATFEHQTQASTGATTGSWLILFSIPSCTSCQETFGPVFETLGQDEALYENGIVLATVDCHENTSVCRRFAVTQLPTIVFLHKKKLYTFATTIATTTTDTTYEEQMASQLKQFVLSDFATVSVAMPIPDPPSIMDTLMMMEPLARLYDAGATSPLLGMAIVTLASMLFFTVLVLVYVLVRGRTTKTVPPKSKTKKS